jgi:hypothetical protein
MPKEGLRGRVVGSIDKAVGEAVAAWEIGRRCLVWFLRAVAVLRLFAICLADISYSFFFLCFLFLRSDWTHTSILIHVATTHIHIRMHAGYGTIRYSAAMKHGQLGFG